MLHFPDAVDREWLAEIKDAGLLAPDAIERIHGLMGRPESAPLNDFLIAGAGVVAEGPWLSWLIRRHGCHRHGKPTGPLALPLAPSEGIPPDGNLAYRRGADSSILVAVLRPDLLPATAQRLAGGWHRSAVTLREMGALRLALDPARPADPAP
jgi:hypothetical protein